MKMPAESRSSNLLTPDENELVFSFLGPRCQALATTVVELYTTGSRDSDEWYYKDMGVLCLVKDNARRSFFFRLFCLVKKQMTWEHEIYKNMNYLAPTSFLHTFEAEDCITAFNFADEDEGAYLRDTLLEKLETNRQRRLEKKRRSLNNNVDAQRTVAGPEMNNLHSITPAPNAVVKPRPAAKKEGKKRLTKADIGPPQNFMHIVHLGPGFDFGKIEDPQLRQFFDKAGVSEMHLRDKDTREFIYDFIQRNGGMEAVAGALETAPPVPTRMEGGALTGEGGGAFIPPPPPPIGTLPPMNLPLKSSPKPPVGQTDFVAPPPPPIPGAPPPPPPAPSEPAPFAARPVNNVTNEQMNVPDSRDELINQIRQGVKLKPFSQPVNNVTNEQKNVPDSRDELLNQIRLGVKLKPVTPVSQDPNTTPSSEFKDLAGDLAGALARVLAERQKVLYSGSESDDDGEEKEDDGEEKEDDDWKV